MCELGCQMDRGHHRCHSCGNLILSRSRLVCPSVAIVRCPPVVPQILVVDQIGYEGHPSVAVVFHDKAVELPYTNTGHSINGSKGRPPER